MLPEEIYEFMLWSIILEKQLLSEFYHIVYFLGFWGFGAFLKAPSINLEPVLQDASRESRVFIEFVHNPISEFDK